MSWRLTVSMPRNVYEPSCSFHPVLMPASAIHAISAECGVDEVTSRNVITAQRAYSVTSPVTALSKSYLVPPFLAVYQPWNV